MMHRLQTYPSLGALCENPNPVFRTFAVGCGFRHLATEHDLSSGTLYPMPVALHGCITAPQTLPLSMLTLFHCYHIFSRQSCWRRAAQLGYISLDDQQKVRGG